jgi:predicted ATP-binding protein involved in virulence
MSRIDKLSIRGIRSFDPSQEIKIEFFTPLTLIQGQNGSGKTVHKILKIDNNRMFKNGNFW